MARIRTIKPGFWGHEQLGRLSFLARLTFIGMWSLADDEGRGRGSQGALWADLHKHTPSVFKTGWGRALKELAAVQDDRGHLVYFYDVAGATYYWLPGFKRQQRIDKPQASTFPAHPDSENILRMIREQSTLERRGEEGNGMEGRGRGIGMEPPTPSQAPAALGTPEGAEDRRPIETGGTPPAAADQAEIERTAHAFDAWSHPPLDKRMEAVVEMRAMGMTFDYIRAAADPALNNPAKVPFWHVVRALKEGRKYGKNGTVANVPTASTAPARMEAPREDVVAKALAAKARLTADQAQKKRDDAVAQVDQLLKEMDPEVREDWAKDAEAEVRAKKVPAPAIPMAVSSALRVRCARENGITLG